MPSNIYCVVLAAGQSRRYGRTKLLEELDGKSLLRGTLETAQVACPGSVCLVTGHAADAVFDAARGLADLVAHNSDFETGLGSSIRCGVRACRKNADAILMVLADQPLVTATHLVDLVASWDGNANGIVASGYANTFGPPVLFGSAYFDRLENLEGDVGARQILRHNKAAIVAVRFEEASVDIDTPADLAACPSRR